MTFINNSVFLKYSFTQTNFNRTPVEVDLGSTKSLFDALGNVGVYPSVDDPSAVPSDYKDPFDNLDNQVTT